MEHFLQAKVSIKHLARTLNRVPDAVNVFESECSCPGRLKVLKAVASMIVPNAMKSLRQ